MHTALEEFGTSTVALKQSSALLRMYLKIQSIFGTRIFQYIAAITSTLGIISCEMHYGWPSPSLPILESGNYSFRINSDEASWLAVILLPGAIIGSFLSAYTADFFGRRKVILFAAIPLSVAWIMIGLAKNIYVMHAARFLAGIADGLAFSTVPMYLGEISDPKIRGMISMWCPTLMCFGMLLINILGVYLPLNTAAFVSSVLPMTQLFAFFWMPDSPTYLLLNGKQRKAEEALVTFRGAEFGKVEYERLVSAYKNHNSRKAGFMDIFASNVNRKAMFIVFALRTIQQLSGCSPVIFYCNTIFKTSGNFVSPEVGTIIYFSINVLMTTLSSFLVDKVGRRPLMLISTSGTAASLFTLGSYIYLDKFSETDTSSFDFIPVMALFTYITFFGMGIQTMPFCMAGEIFSPEIKALAVCLASVNYDVLSIVTSKYFHFTTDKYGMHVPFFTFGTCVTCGLIWAKFYLPETKGKTLEDIQTQLGPRKTSSHNNDEMCIDAKC